MPVIKVWCLPPHQTEADLQKLHKTIISSVVGILELELKDQNDMTCLFPPDLMQYGLGEEIIIEVTGLFDKPLRTPDVRRRLARSLSVGVHSLYQQSKVECFVYPFYPDEEGFWVSKN